MTLPINTTRRGARVLFFSALFVCQTCGDKGKMNNISDNFLIARAVREELEQAQSGRWAARTS